MKWIGQHIWDLMARFRSSVYLEDVNNSTSDLNKFLSLDSDGLVLYRTGAQVYVDIMPTTIKVLPHHFMSNEDGGVNKSAQFDDTGTIGVRTTHDDAELYAFVEIPRGMKAAEVTVYGNDTSLVVALYESDITAGALTQVDGGSCTVGSGCALDTQITADETNYLVIQVRTAAHATDIIYGAVVEITPP